MNTKMAGAFALALTALVSFIHPGISAASSINIDFGTILFGIPASDYGAASGQAGYWNGISDTGSTALKNLSGNLIPGAAVTVSASASMGGYFSGAYAFNDQRLVQDNFYTIGDSWTVGLTGLDNGNYDLYVYGPSNPNVSTSSFLVNGVAQANLTTPYGSHSPLAAGIDYEIVKLLVSNHTIDIASGADRDYFSGLSGLQLVQVASTPLPGSLLLFGSALGALGLVTWRKKSGRALAA